MDNENTIHFDLFVRGACRVQKKERPKRRLKNGILVNAELVEDILNFEKTLKFLKGIHKTTTSLPFVEFLTRNNITSMQYKNLLRRIKIGYYDHLKKKEFTG